MKKPTPCDIRNFSDTVIILRNKNGTHTDYLHSSGRIVQIGHIVDGNTVMNRRKIDTNSLRYSTRKNVAEVFEYFFIQSPYIYIIENHSTYKNIYQSSFNLTE